MRSISSQSIPGQNTISSNEESPQKPNFSQTNKPDDILSWLKNKLEESTLSDLPTSPIQKISAHTNLLISKKPVLNVKAATQKSLVFSELPAPEIDLRLLKKKLEKYKKYIIKNKNNEITYDMLEEFIQKDAYFVKFFAEAENSRKEGLNLKTFNNREEFLSHLCQINKNPDILECHERAVIRFTPLHFISADIKVRKSEKGENITTVIFIDSLSNRSQNNAYSLREMFKNDLFKGAISSAVFLDADVQTSWMDCAIFSISHALKFHQDQKRFSELHNDMEKKYLELSEKNGEEFKEIYLKFKSICSAKDYHQKFLTSNFYKHTQSRRKLEEIVDARDWEEELVNKSGCTLLDRYDTKSINIKLNNGKVITKSVSIENKRLVLVQRTIDHINKIQKQNNKPFKWLCSPRLASRIREFKLIDRTLSCFGIARGSMRSS